MSKSKKTTTKLDAKPAKSSKRGKATKAQTASAVEAMIATDAAANALAVNPDLVPLTEAMKPAKAAKGSKVKTPKAEIPKKVSGLDAAHQVLTDSGQPMRCKDMVDKMIGDGLWKTVGKTPAATIYAAILREIQTKGEQARFKKTDRGLFVAA